MKDSKNTTGLNLLHNAEHHNVSKVQEKVKKYFLNLSKKEQKTLIEEFEEQKITSDILKTIYKKEGIEGTIMNVMFFGWIRKYKNISKD